MNRFSLLKIILSVSVLLSLVSYTYQVNFLAEEDNYQDYDYYVLSINWGNTLCIGSRSCQERLSGSPKNTMTMHGLWPSLSSGAMLETCNQGQTIEVIDDGSEIFKEMNTYWRSVMGPNKSFWEHEYNKHGYCYAQKTKDFQVKDYFQMALGLYKKLDLQDIISKAFGNNTNDTVHYSYIEIKDALQKVAPELHFELSCSNKNKVQYLKEIRFMLDLEFNPKRVQNFRTDCNINKEISIIYA